MEANEEKKMFIIADGETDHLLLSKDSGDENDLLTCNILKDGLLVKKSVAWLVNNATWCHEG